MAGMGNSGERWNRDEGSSQGKAILSQLKAACIANNEARALELLKFICSDGFYEGFEQDKEDYLRKGAGFTIAEHGSLQLIGNYMELDVVTKDGSSALHLTMLDSNVARGLGKAKVLVGLGANPMALDDRKRSLLHLAAWRSNEHAVGFFLLHGLDVNGVDVEGKTPLQYAMMDTDEGAKMKKVQLLLDNGADSNQSGGGAFGWAW